MADQPNTYMNISKRILAGLGVLSLLLGLAGPISVSAATTPTLGQAASYAVLASTYTNTVAGTTINGDIGFTTGPAVAPLGVHTNYGSGAPYATAGVDQGTALTALAGETCTFTFDPGPINLSTDTTHGPIGVYTPGVYCSSGAMNVGGPLTLSGSGTYIFRSVGALTSTAGAIVTLTGASACDVFWTPTQATTLAANTTFAGTIIADAGITVGANSTWTGRALAFGGTVTSDTDTITGPTCTSPAPAVVAPASRASYNTLTVFKQVINDNGGTALFTDFPLFIGTNSTNSGESVRLIPGLYTVSETSRPNYTTTFVGDCNANGVVNHGGINTHNDICTIVNDDIGTPVAPIPPLIHITKIPNPLALPAGPGLVTYDFAVSNVGIAPMTNVTVTDQKCGAVTFLSGDTDLDARLDVGEIWNYQCAMTLNQTTENTVTATGQANGLTATDIAVSTVVVGSPLTPPLIDLTKVPTPLFLPAGGGLVKYNYIMNNPGVVALSNVSLTDDRCTQLIGPFGDTDADNLLDTDEAWNYTCQMQLNATTTNTATAEGSANGFTVRHISVVTVAVAAPGLPNTGFGPFGNPRVLMVIGEALVAIALLFVVTQRKRLFS